MSQNGASGDGEREAIIGDQTMNTPQALLAHTGKTFPELWREVDAARARKGDDLPDWADHVFLPLAAWYAITCNLFDVEVLSDDMVTTMGILACIGAWRPTQDIVRFDPDVYVSLSKTGIDGNLPVDVLKRLPAWCLYIETPGLIYDERVWEGFFVFLESDANTGHDELRIIFSSQECAYYPCILHIGPWTLQHACKLSNDFSTTLLYERGKKIDGKHPICVDLGLQTALNCILYVCSYGLNDQEGWGSSGSIAYPRPRRVKSGWRLFPPDQPQLRILGQIYGEQIRQSIKDSEGGARPHASPRPHVRRAHWHGYWTGPHAATRKFDLRWLPPIPVAMRDEKR